MLFALLNVFTLCPAKRLCCGPRVAAHVYESGAGGQQEVAEDEAQRREGLPVLLGELCADDPLRRHPDLNLDRGSIPEETIFNILTKVLKVKRPLRYLMRGLLS